MLPNINRVVLVGRAEAAPEKRGEKGFVVFVLTTTKQYKNKDGQQMEIKARHNITVFDRELIEYAIENIIEGSYVAVEGELTYNSYETKGGVKMTATNVVINRGGFLLVIKECSSERVGCASLPKVSIAATGMEVEYDTIPF